MQQQIDEVARVYAESLFELAEKAGGISQAQEIGAEFAGLADIMRGDKRLQEFLRSPIVDRTSREKSLQSMLSGRVSDLLLRFILTVNRKGRSAELFDIERGFDALLQEKLGKVEVDVWTAGPLGPEALRTIQSRVAEAIGKDVVLHTYTDPSMIGGVKLQIGDRLIDGSVAAKLRSLRGHLTEAGGDVRASFQQYLDR